VLNVVWTHVPEGREHAPPDVRAALASWERMNPGWELRCLDATTVERYAPLPERAGIVPLLLLREFGGVWIDPALVCVRPLDDWLPGVMREGFFAFAGSYSAGLLATSFLSAEYGSGLVSSWCRTAVEAWSARGRSGYFSIRDVFRDLCLGDEAAAAAWSRIPRASARDRVAFGEPVAEHAPADPRIAPAFAAPVEFAALSVSTENLGDHIQILAGLRMLSRLGITPTKYIDRDHEIASAPGLAPHDGPVGILLNGWFKSNRSEWPPHPKLAPLMLGFHIRLFQCPELVSDASIEYFRRHEPIGCRDVYTESLLRSKGVDAFTSHCLSLTLPRRTDDPRTQTEVFVVSRDERIRDLLPEAIGPYAFVSHYSGSSDFDANMARAAELLETYRTRAKLLVTTLLHCALPAIAMGIPVVVFYPINDERLHASDRERFSSLESLVRVHRLEEMDGVDWNPAPVDAGGIKLRILDRFYDMAGRWAIASRPPISSVPA
jgi:hypothetical protein